ncbi:MAG: NAD-dependent succinate-semialdehyde dehydrogenase [Candidatus Micrarchaeota archaeon]|nr:NAD-dependent succinate-semialdehyde dehydrogenase [Candidatus Micrarchaeota archaeon]
MNEMISINPATGETIAKYKCLGSDEAFEEVKKARKEFKHWSLKPLAERKELVRKLGETLKKNKDKYAKIITEEMGKPITQAIAEVEKCALVCNYYYENCEKFLANDNIQIDGVKKSYVKFQPLGVILGIMPWNYPFWQAIRYAVPAMLAGNVCLLKHASNVPGSALAIEDAFVDAGFPKDAFKTLLINGKVAGEIINSDLVEGVSLTGSNEAGEKVGEIAGKKIKKIVLELGGSDPFIVLKDADLKLAWETGVSARFQNNGQSCIAAKRFILHVDIAEEFTKNFLRILKSWKIGDPLDRNTNAGPLAREDLLKELEKQVKRAVENGGKIITGGKRIPGKGAFYEPTVIEMKKDNPVLQEEIFGPVASIVVCSNEEEQLEIANNTQYGLGASVWSRDRERAEEFASKVEAGMVFVNSMVKSDPKLPFGGVKKSGIGRELSQYGIREFTNIKTIVIN